MICLSHYSPPGVSTGFAAEQGAGSSSFIPKQLAPNLSFKERESRLVTAGAPPVDAPKKNDANNLSGHNQTIHLVAHRYIHMHR